jgi:HEAT repeat protein
MTTRKKILLLLRSSDETDRRTGIIELVRIQDPLKGPLLLKMAGEDPSVELRYYAKKALDALVRAQTIKGDPPARIMARTIAEMLDAADPQTRLAGLKKAMESPHPEMKALIKQSLDREVLPHLKASFIITLGRIGSDEDIPLLRECLNDDDQRIRANAVEALAHIGSDQALMLLVPLIGDPDNRVKANALGALQTCGHSARSALLARMATDEPVWMRDSAIYALSRFPTPETLAILTRISHHDPLPRLREKAQAGVLLLTKNRPESEAPAPGAANPAYASSPSQPFSTVGEGCHPGGATTDLLSPHPLKRRLALLKIGNSPNPAELFAILQALQQETDIFLETRQLQLLRGSNFSAAVPIVIRRLTSTDDRVRAHAVEALGSIDPENGYAVLLPHLRDGHNRVRANVIIALLGNAAFDPLPPLQAMAEDPREPFRQSALHVISQSPRSEFVPILADLLNDPTPNLRDSAFQSLKKFRRLGIPGIEELHGRIQTRIGLSLFPDRFFENTFDHLFSGILQQKPPPKHLPDFRLLSLAKRERSLLRNLGAKGLAANLLEASEQIDLLRVSQELTIVSQQARSEPDSLSSASLLETIADKELLRMNINSLTRRRNELLIAAGSVLAARASTLSPEALASLAPEIHSIHKLTIYHVPPVDATLLPSLDSGFSEIFDLTMRIYQKHVLAFSALAIILGTILATFVLSAALVYGTVHQISFPFRMITLLIIGGAFLVLLLLLNGTMKLSVPLMLKAFLQGSSPDYRHILHRLIATRCLAEIQLRKFGFLFAWSLWGLLLSFATAGGMTSLTEAYQLDIPLGRSLVKTAGIIAFLLAMVKPFTLYLLVEPVAVLASCEGPIDSIDSITSVDPIDRARRLASPHIFRILGLFLLSSTLTTFITATSNEILSLFAVFSRSRMLLIGFALFSKICLYPIVYSNLVVFTMMLARQDKQPGLHVIARTWRHPQGNPRYGIRKKHCFGGFPNARMPGSAASNKTPTPPRLEHPPDE